MRVDVGTVDAALVHLGCRAQVLTVDPGTLREVLASIVTVGERTGHAAAAHRLVAGLAARLDRVAAAVAGRGRPRVAVLEWTDPPFTAGHWVPDMVAAAGGAPTLGEAGQRSQATTWEAVARSRADLVVVAPCGYALPAAVDIASRVREGGHLPAGVPVWAVDADAAFVRPGPRLLDGVEALAAIIHPDVVAARSDLAARI